MYFIALDVGYQPDAKPRLTRYRVTLDYICVKNRFPSGNSSCIFVETFPYICLRIDIVTFSATL